MLATITHLAKLFLETRQKTESICAPLETEDYVVQPVIDVSPPKWHLGHTTWFFEEFILKKHNPVYIEFDPDFGFVFNSYYETFGKRVVRSNRGNLTRPSVAKIYKYREYVTKELLKLIEENPTSEMDGLIEIGIHHEKQHQELLLTDIKYILGHNPLLPKYNDVFEENPVQNFSAEWITVPEGIYEIGHKENGAFHYDIECNRHKVYLNDYQISNKLVTNQEYMEFVKADGYKNVMLWHSEGWDWVQQNTIEKPMYWHKIDGTWYQYTLQGLKKLDMEAPLSHISYFEAFAYAQWKDCRLPTEFEWEAAQDKFAYGSRWEWTESAYLPYPGYTKPPGAVGEYNGKFMVNQKVLRGGSVASAADHLRPTYRNFFHPQLRWQFTGIRLAK